MKKTLKQRGFTADWALFLKTSPSCFACFYEVDAIFSSDSQMSELLLSEVSNLPTFTQLVRGKARTLPQAF